MLKGTVLTTTAMAAADRAAIASGISGRVLMEAAGAAVVAAIVRTFPPCPVLVLAGPGNNGGDGYVVARRLKAAGWPVRLAASCPPERLKGDAAWAAGTWSGTVHALGDAAALPGDLVVDALFGAGLDRPLAADLGLLIEAAMAGRRHVVAVDVPSGVDGSTGAVSPGTHPADLTVTFCCPKPGHLLEPARRFAGQIICADIGIPASAVQASDTGLRVNTPDEWLAALPRRTAGTHKYSFGHALILGGGRNSTGATGMAALAAARVGAGLVTVAAPEDALGRYAALSPNLMTRPLDRPEDLDRLLADRRFNVVLLGPAAGLGRRTRHLLERLAGAGRPIVLDADALSVLAEARKETDLKPPADCVLTPHDGEFARLLAIKGDRLSRATVAARELGCTVLLKGADTVIAAPDGRARLNGSAPPNLATAGTGDVLAGLVTGLLAQGLTPFDAASAAAWLHARAAASCPTPMLATDLLPRIPEAIVEGRMWGR